MVAGSKLLRREGGVFLSLVLQQLHIWYRCRVGVGMVDGVGKFVCVEETPVTVLRSFSLLR